MGCSVDIATDDLLISKEELSFPQGELATSILIGFYS
jgi:hypothetical protein